MKSLIFILFTGMYLTILNAQAPSIIWQHSYGGSLDDIAMTILPTPDGGYLTSGFTNSDDGDILCNNGESDIWLIKTDSAGFEEWSTCLGGSSYEGVGDCDITADGGYIITGHTTSNDGDVTGNHGGSDIWQVKTSATGSIEWEKAYGGSGYEDATVVLSLSDGNYIFAGVSYSNDGDVTTTHGNDGDFWIVKTDGSGNIIWQRTYGGSSFDFARCMIQASDGNFIVGGSTTSSDGDVEGVKGGGDGWVIKLKSDNGDLVWQTTVGKNRSDIIYGITEDPEGGYFFTGETYSNFPGYHHKSELMVGKIKANGTLKFVTVYGGTRGEEGFAIKNMAGGGFVVIGVTGSHDGDVSHQIGTGDVWVLGLNEFGAIDWEKTYGGSFIDLGYNIEQTNDGGFIFCGASYSHDGDLTNNNGNTDYWLVKLSSPDGALRSGVANKNAQEVAVYPSPARDFIQIACEGSCMMKISNISGEILVDKFIVPNEYFDIHNFVPGIYCVNLYYQNEIKSTTFIKIK